jgi:hypothetical protein
MSPAYEGKDDVLKETATNMDSMQKYKKNLKEIASRSVAPTTSATEVYLDSNLNVVIKSSYPKEDSDVDFSDSDNEEDTSNLVVGSSDEDLEDVVEVQLADEEVPMNSSARRLLTSSKPELKTEGQKTTSKLLYTPPTTASKPVAESVVPPAEVKKEKPTSMLLYTPPSRHPPPREVQDSPDKSSDITGKKRPSSAANKSEEESEEDDNEEEEWVDEMQSVPKGGKKGKGKAKGGGQKNTKKQKTETPNSHEDKEVANVKNNKAPKKNKARK